MRNHTRGRATGRRGNYSAKIEETFQVPRNVAGYGNFDKKKHKSPKTWQVSELDKIISSPQNLAGYGNFDKKNTNHAADSVTGRGGSNETRQLVPGLTLNSPEQSYESKMQDQDTLEQHRSTWPKPKVHG